MSLFFDDIKKILSRKKRYANYENESLSDALPTTKIDNTILREKIDAIIITDLRGKIDSIDITHLEFDNPSDLNNNDEFPTDFNF